jgi:hypothetical protein
MEHSGIVNSDWHGDRTELWSHLVQGSGWTTVQIGPGVQVYYDGPYLDYRAPSPGRDGTRAFTNERL